MKFKHILTLFLLSVTCIASAQKFGHLNSTTLLLELEDVKSADTQLEALAKSLEADYTTRIANFEKAYEALVQKSNSQDYSQVQIQQEQAALAKTQESIQKFELEIQQQLLTKREELYAPILKKVDDVIKAIGDENGFTMIFDTSSGFILHNEDSMDITSMVKAKL